MTVLTVSTMNVYRCSGCLHPVSKFEGLVTEEMLDYRECLLCGGDMEWASWTIVKRPT